MSPQVSVGMILRYASNNFTFIIFNPTQRTSWSYQDFYRRKEYENVHQPICIDYPNVTTRIHKVDNQKIHQVDQQNIPLSPRISHRKTYIKCSHIQKIQSDITKPQRARLNSSQEGRGGETPYDPTILTKPAIHQDRDIPRTWDRERD